MMNSLRSRGSVKMRALAVTPLLALAVTAGAISHANASDSGSAKPTVITKTARPPVTPTPPTGRAPSLATTPPR